MPRDPLGPECSEAARVYAYAIKRLGRNVRPDDGEALDAETMRALWAALLAGRYSPAQEAALLMGLRVHGESAGMLAACANGTKEFVVAVPVESPVVVLPCLGAARKHASLAPLLALRLQALGVGVLIVAAGRAEGSAAGVLRALGRPTSASVDDAAANLRRDRFAWVELATLAPAVARLVALRAELGFRNTAHTVIKLVSPVEGPAVMVAHYTHGEYRARLSAAIEALSLDALLVRGTEGDPVAWDGTGHPPLAWRRGAPVAMERAQHARPAPPAVAGDDAATAGFCERALAEATLPPAIEQQAQWLRRLTDCVGEAS
jgi:anthranilate phosphoribosyltransferase